MRRIPFETFIFGCQLLVILVRDVTLRLLQSCKCDATFHVTTHSILRHILTTINRYLGVRLVDLTPARPKATYEPSVIVQYADGEVSWFLRIVEKELWLYRSADAGEQELSSLIDRRKWKRRKISVEESSRRYVFAYVRIHEST